MAEPCPGPTGYFNEKTDEIFILEPAALRAGKLDPSTSVTGSDQDKPLGEALIALLKPLNLTYVIRDELVMLTPLPESR